MSAAESGPSAAGGERKADDSVAETDSEAVDVAESKYPDDSEESLDSAAHTGDKTKADGCFLGLRNGGTKVDGFLPFLKYLGVRMPNDALDADCDKNAYLYECVKKYAEILQMPTPAKDCSTWQLFCRMLRKECDEAQDFYGGVYKFYARANVVFPKGRLELRSLLATNGQSAPSACDKVKELVKLGRLSPTITIFTYLILNLTPKELFAFQNAMFPAFGHSWRIYDDESKRVLNAEQFAAKMGNVRVVEVIRKLTDDGVRSEALRIALDAVIANAEGSEWVAKPGSDPLEAASSKRKDNFPEIVRRRLKERRSINPQMYRAARIEDETLEDDVIESLKACVKSGDGGEIAFAHRIAKQLLAPSVYVVVAETAKVLARDLHLREDMKQALAADVFTDEAKDALAQLCDAKNPEFQSTPDDERDLCHHRHFKEPCTRKVDLDLADSCSSGRTKPSDDYVYNIYPLEILIDAAIMDPLFEAEMMRLHGDNLVLHRGTLQMGPPKDIRRVRSKAVEYTDSEFPKSGAVSDMLRCTLTFEDVFFLLQAFIELKTTFSAGVGGPLVEGQVIMELLRVKNGFLKLAALILDKYVDVKLNISIRSLVAGRVVTVIGEVQLSAEGLSTYKVHSHYFYAITRESELYKAAVRQMADFSLSKLVDGASIERLLDSGYIETDADQILESWFRVAGCDSASHRSLETVAKWFGPNPFENQPIEVVEFAFDLILKYRCNRRDFVKTLNSIPAEVFQTLLQRCMRYPYCAPVVRYCERVTHFKKHIADMLIPNVLPKAKAKWPMGAESETTALHSVAWACARFGDSAARVLYVKDKLMLDVPSASTLPDAVELYTQSGGRSTEVLAALKAAHTR